jgi:hypothetical protein
MTLLRRTLAEMAFYPVHAPRTASALYTREHHELVVVQDQPCRVCGVRSSTLTMGPLYNPHGAKALETHHDLIEWAGQTEVDWDKLAADHPTLPNLAAVARAYHAHLLAGGKPGDIIDPAIVTQFVDSAEQLEVLCDVHHRAPFKGIHSITSPLFELQQYEAPGYSFVDPPAAKP